MSTEYDEARRYDISPISIFPWNEYKLDGETEAASDYSRSLLAIERGALGTGIMKPFDVLCRNALFNALFVSSSLNNRIDHTYLEGLHDTLSRDVIEATAPIEEYIYTIRDNAVIEGIEYARLTAPGDPEAVRHIDDTVDQALGAMALSTSFVADKNPTCRLKAPEEAGQIIVVKQTVAQHFEGAILSKRRHMIGIDTQSSKVDKKLLGCVEAARQHIRSEEYYSQNHPEILSILMPYLNAYGREPTPPWLSPLSTTYFALRPSE